VTIPNVSTSVSVTYTKSESHASVAVTGDTNLSVGDNTVMVTVTAENGTTKAYTVVVTRAASAAATLTSTIGVVSTGGTANETITNIPNTTTLAALKAAITPATYATFEVYNANGTTVATTLATGNKVIVTAQNGTTKVTYTVTITPSTPSGGGSGSPTPTSDTPVTSTDGKLTLPTGKSGEVSLGDAVMISIPAGATGKELKLTIEKVLSTQNLLTDKDILVSPIYEILKNFLENFSKPVTLTFAFDKASLKSGQQPAVCYYDEVKKSWVKVGGTVNGDHIKVEVDHFTKFAVFAVDQASIVPPKDPSTDTKPTINLSDISGHWAEAYIKQAVSSGIVTGYPDGTFKPNDSVTRAEFAVMLMNTWKPQGAGTSLTFTDTAKIGTWAQKAVAQAVQAGIIQGYEDGNFRPDAEITRSEMAVMIAKALGLPIEANAATGFADNKDIPAWAKDAVAAIKKHGLVEGKGSNAFDPIGKTTRAEAVTVLLKALAQKSK
jgi:hypothetical protein